MKSKITALLILFSITCLSSFGQVTDGEKSLRTQSADTTQGWKKGGVFSLNLAQTSLTNWAAGGQKSVAINGIFSVFANLKKGKSAWDNSLDLGYGIMKQGELGYRKTDDKIELNSKFGREAFKNVYYAALTNFKTQMTAGYSYPTETTKTKISNKFAPAYWLFALGLDYKPNANFSAFLAPLTSRFTFVTDPELYNLAGGAFGVPQGKKSRSEVGGYLRVIFTKNDFKGEFLKNISLTSKIDLFSNYADNPQNVDVNWENLLAMKVNKYISVSFNTVLIYDDNTKILKDGQYIGSLVQFKEIFGAGLSYKF